MRALEMVGLTSSAFSEFEDNYKKILDIKSIFHKQVALEAKIEKIEVCNKKIFRSFHLTIFYFNFRMISK